jgi:inositol transport system substrate-binding protein
MNNTFQTYLVDAATAKAKELGVTLTVSDAQNDVVKQQDQVKAFIQQGVDAVIVVAGDSSAMEPVTEAAAKAGIPLVYCNIYPFGDDENLPENVYYVGSQELEAGNIQGEYIGKALNGEGSICILMGGLAYEASYKRTQGVEDALTEKYPNIKVLAKETAEWQRDAAVDVVNNWLTAYGDQIKGICANNDEMALGAIEALKAAGRQDVVVLGVDAIPDAVQSILNKELAATVFQDSKGQGGGAVDIAYKVLSGEKLDSQITWVPFIQVDETNASEYVDAN